MKLNERIVQLRRRAGMTQEQLGEKLGVSRQAVSKWESGQANPDVTYLAEMCRLFEVSADWLLLGREPVEASAPAFPVEEERYCVYLVSGLETGIARRVVRLFEHSWAVPAFPWEVGQMDLDAAMTIIEAAPMVLCQGLTKEQAACAAKVFKDYPRAIQIYRESELLDEEGRGIAVGDPLSIEETRESMGPGTVFFMVVLGVIAAVLLMAFF